jgi:hypothetical protein
MNETRLAHPTSADATREQNPQQEGNEIRLLDDLELALAGGGDLIVNWP